MKRRKWIAGALMILTAAAAIAYGIAGGPKRERLTFTPPMQSGAQRDVMYVESVCAYDLRSISGTQTVSAVNRTQTDRQGLTLNLYANGVVPGSVTITEAQVNGERAAVQMQADAPEKAMIPFEWKAGETAEVSWRFALTIPKGQGVIASKDDQTVAIGGLPMPAADTEGGTYDVLAETSYAWATDIEMTMSIPEEIDVGFGGTLAEYGEVQDGRRQYTVRHAGARDVSFVLMRDAVIRETMDDGILLTVMGHTADEARRLQKAAKRAMNRLEAIGLTYPFASLTVVEADTGRSDGAVGSALIVCTSEGDDALLTECMTRLCARQIFGISVENDPVEAPWLSLTLASAAQILAEKKEMGESAYRKRFEQVLEPASRVTRPRGVCVGAASTAFAGDAEMTQVLRDRGGGMLMGIAESCTDEALMRALCAYAQECAGGMGSREALEAALEAQTGSSWRDYLTDGLGD